MDWWNAERITTLIAVLAAILAWGAAHCADRRAKDANNLAEDANTTAERALAEAMEANRIAQDANKISSDANTISERALAIAEDNLEYSWELDIDYNEGVPVFVNNSAHAAYDVSITVRTEQRQVAHAFEKEVPPFSKFRFEAELITEELAEDARSIARLNSSRGFHFIKGPSCSTKGYVMWNTESGTKRNSVIEHVFRN